jgi:aspartate ammonia-lyase
MTDCYRTERDFLGEKPIPASAYWGIHTARALENFPISGTPISAMPDLVRALAFVKKAAASTNLQLGVLDARRANAICAACARIISGELLEQFVVDVIQGGAGTSTNMNANEVIANAANEQLGHAKGEYAVVHPNDHVNASQSTNDVYPTAVRVALWFGIETLLVSMHDLRGAFERKAQEFSDVLKIGRTQLQDAVPMTLGQEFSAYAVMLEEDEERLREARRLIQEINLGATAIGTGINAPHGYADLACRSLAEKTGLPLRRSKNLVEATQDTGAFVQLSGVLKRIAVKLSKTCNDLRLLSSGPQAGFGDIKLPPRQAGSSIMPGKVNPVIPEVVNQIAFEVIGNDLTITMASEGGQLQLNAFEPIMGWSLFKSMRHLARGCDTLARHCVDGIEANHEVLRRRVRESITVVTALNPIIGYEKAALIAKTAMTTGRPVIEVAQTLDLLGSEEIDALLVPKNLTQPSAPEQGTDRNDRIRRRPTPA